MPQLTVSEVARRLSRATSQTISPQDISNLFYKRHLDDDRCPVVGRCRLIPEDYVPAILEVLVDRGLVVPNYESEVADKLEKPAAERWN